MSGICSFESSFNAPGYEVQSFLPACWYTHQGQIRCCIFTAKETSPAPRLESMIIDGMAFSMEAAGAHLASIAGTSSDAAPTPINLFCYPQLSRNPFQTFFLNFTWLELHLYHALCIKKSRQTENNHGPISHSEIICKLLERLIKGVFT